MAPPAVHRTIVVVDVAGFGDPRRTNANQLAVRAALYRLLTTTFGTAGIPWHACDHEDRGDGVLVIIPPEIPKSVLVEHLPSALGAELRAHNTSCRAEERITLRMALHAGEVHYDDHGVTGWAVNLAFRLLEARPLKEALAESSAVLAIVTSSWFYEDVVRHSPMRDHYHRVSVRNKETATTAWIHLPDHPDRPRGLDSWADTREATPVVPHQLPVAVRQFVGREKEITTLTALLDSSTASNGTVIITAIAGTAGIGKTTLATYWAHRAKDRFPDGQLHVNLRGFDPDEPMDPGQALHGFLLALGVAPSTIPADLETRAALYRTLLADRRVLILLDNAHSPDHVRPLLPGTPGSLVIVTSRDRLDGLVVHEGAHRIALDLLSTQDAHTLLSRRLGQSRLDTEPEETAQLIELCARLPLALSIVAARAASQPTLPIAHLVRDLRDERDRLDALDLGHLDLDLRAVFSRSYAVLSPPAAHLFRLLGIHPGSDIDRHACAALLDNPARTAPALRELTAAHVLDEHTPGRFRCHDLLRVYAAEQATRDEPAADRSAALHRLLDHYLTVALAADVHIQRCRDGAVRSVPPSTAATPIASAADAMAWFAAENANLLAMITAAARHGFHSHAGRLAWACTTYLRRTGQRHERAAVHSTALTAARRHGDPKAEVTALDNLARALARLDRNDEALAALDEALVLHRKLGDKGEIHTMLNYVTVFESQQRHMEALEYAQRAWQLVERTGSRLWRANTLIVLGRQTAILGHHTDALPMCEHALRLYQELEHPEGEADVLATLGNIRHSTGHHALAITCYERALAIDRELGDQFWESVTLDALGDAHHANGESDRAGSAWRSALEIFEALRLPCADIVRAKLIRSGSPAAL